MSTHRTILRYASPYKRLISAHVVANLIMVLFDVVSIPTLVPFLRILFKEDELVTVRPEWSLSVEGVTGNFNYWLSEIILTEGYQRALVYMCVFIVLVFFGKNLFRFLALATIAPLRANIVRDMRNQLFGHLLTLPVGYFSERRRGDLISRFTGDVQEVESSILNSFADLIRSPLLILGALAFMLYTSPLLTLFTVVLLGVTAVIIGGISRVLRRQGSQAQEALSSLVSQIDEALGGLRVVKAFRAEGYLTERFRKTNQEYRNVLVRLLRRRDLSSPLSEFLGISVVAALIYYGFGRIEAGEIDVAVFLAFVYAFFTTVQPSKQFSNAFYNLQRGRAALERVEQVLGTTNAFADRPDALPVRRLAREIRFESVSFSYPNTEHPALDDVSLALPVGRVVALVGASGAGKSTLADLIPRFYDVDEGSIRFDGTDVRELRLDELRRQVGIVSQDVVLFHDTIYANIVFGTENTTRESVERAARQANAHDFILAQPQGYATIIGDRGDRLSGGQRQRLTLARAILQDAPVMILDEATSALDAESELAVQAALFRLMEGRTCLVIAHRMATIQAADEILVMDSGKIIERGDHASLLEARGAYARLIDLQTAFD